MNPYLNWRVYQKNLRRSLFCLAFPGFPSFLMCCICYHSNKRSKTKLTRDINYLGKRITFFSYVSFVTIVINDLKYLSWINFVLKKFLEFDCGLHYFWQEKRLYSLRKILENAYPYPLHTSLICSSVCHLQGSELFLYNHKM